MGIFHNLSPDTVAFPWAKRTPLHGLLSTIAIALAIAIGHWSGHPSAGAIAAGAAFTVGFAVFHVALASTLLSMAVVTVGVASATLAGSLGASREWLVLVLCVIAAINYGLLSGLGATSGWIGQQCAVFVIIASGFNHGRHYAVGRAEMVLLGGAMQMAVYFIVHVVGHSHAPRPDYVRQLSTRSGQLWRGLRDELHWSAETTGYVLRLAVVLLVSTFIYQRMPYGNGYWAPMTALLVLKPEWSGTLSRSIARLLGTLTGAGVALWLAHTASLPVPLIFIGVLVFAWGCYLLQAVNYAAFSFCITLYVVFSFRLGGFSQPAAAHLRLLNTAIGGCVALLIDWLWDRLGMPRVQVAEQKPLTR
jgi:hypothetical protein